MGSGLPGIEEAIRRVYPLAGWQRCAAHPVRQSQGEVRARDMGLIQQDLRGVYMAWRLPPDPGDLQGVVGWAVSIFGGRLVGELEA